MSTSPFLRPPFIHAFRTAAPVWMRLALQTPHLMVGIPNYQTYVKHRQTFHRGEPVMSYADFFRERQAACYAVEKGSVSGIC